MVKPVTPLNLRSLSDEIVDILQRSILMGAYKPGDRLIERELANQFGVSSIPVREALQILEGRGLVRRRRNRSCSVVELTPEELQQVIDLRNLLEPQVVKWACARMTTQDIRELETQLQKLKQAAEEKDVASFFYQDLLFHQLLWAKSGNRYAAEALDRSVGSLFACGLMRAEGEKPPVLEVEVGKHERLVEALRERKASAAADILTRIAQDFSSEVQTHRGGQA